MLSPRAGRWAWVVAATLLLAHTGYAKGNTERAGDVLYLVIPLTGAVATLYKHDHRGTIQFAESFATTMIVTEALKTITHKRRPNGENYTSFPSGHASVSFMGAAFIHRRYGFEYAIPAYLGATFVAYSRVKAKKHYTEDVLAGAAVGILSSVYFTSSHRNAVISPIVGNGVWGINVIKKW